jgi:excisionase family DNA binding protein
LLSAQEVAELLKVSLRKYEQMVKAGEAPPHIRLGRLRRWPVDEVTEWMEQLLRASAETPHIREEED